MLRGILRCVASALFVFLRATPNVNGVAFAIGQHEAHRGLVARLCGLFFRFHLIL